MRWPFPQFSLASPLNRLWTAEDLKVSLRHLASIQLSILARYFDNPRFETPLKSSNNLSSVLSLIFLERFWSPKMLNGRVAAKRLVETTGGPKILMALLQSGPSYVKSLSYDTRLVDTTVRTSMAILLEMRLVKITNAPDGKKVPHAKEYYDLTVSGHEVAVELRKCEQDMIKLLDKVLRQHHNP